jgi:aminoglycoside phosphotransferase (APT) family kinase protein
VTGVDVRTVTTFDPSTVFAGLGLNHPFGKVLHGLRAQLAQRPPPPSGDTQLVSSEVKGRRTGSGWQLERFFSCFQTWTEDPEHPFAASTLYWTARTGRAEWFDFPAEPYLTRAAAYLAPSGGTTRRYDVLRYMPLRRLTVLTGHAGSQEVVKFKRRSQVVEAFTRVRAVCAAAAGTPVRVPVLHGLDRFHSAYGQSAVPGTAMDQLVDPGSVEPLLVEAGRVHAEFHDLACPNLPLEEADDAVGRVVDDTDWLAAMLPELQPRLVRLRDRLVDRWPRPPREPVTCHGDLIPSHLLTDGGAWTVIDLEVARLGDPHRDVALFLAGLPADLGRPDLVRTAQTAYLAGYGERSGRSLDRRSLAWHWTAAELHLLAVAAAKDHLGRSELIRAVEALTSRETGAVP